jgi:VCBS repeat-containing protein
MGSNHKLSIKNILSHTDVGFSCKRHIKSVIVIVVVSLFFINIGNTSGISQNDPKSIDRGTIWEVTLHFNETSGKNDYVIIGEATDATDGPPHDDYDIPMPPNPPFPPYISAWLDDGLSYPYNKLIRDFRYYPDINKTWNLTVKWVNDSDIGTNITIYWDIAEFNPCEYVSVVLMRKNQLTEEWFNVTDMLNENSYTYNHYKIWIDPPGFWYWFLTDDFKIKATSTTENIPPIANDDFYNISEDTTLNVVAPGVLGNDIDDDGPEALTAFLDDNVNHGNLIFNIDGSFEYTPNSDWSGIDYFTYHAYDGENNSNIATVTITVNPQNDDPVANDDAASVEEYSSNNQIDVLNNDYDIDGDSLEVIDVTIPSHGIAIYDEYYVYYTPDDGYFGPDSFMYTITDNNGSAGVTASVFISVLENVPPEKPEKPSGETQGTVGEEYAYTTSTTDENNDQTYYYFSWGDGTTSGWIGPYESGEIVEEYHTWSKRGNYEIKVKAMDEHGQVSEWSDPLPISMPLLKNIFGQNKIINFLLSIFDWLFNDFNILNL